MTIPLAQRLRPQTIEEIIGQEKLTAPGSSLRQALNRGNLPSFILWGPPGTGKTTIALALAQEISADFQQLSAVTSGIKDLRAIIKTAQEKKADGQQTVLFVDEIHRWNKSQQDALLPYVEQGLITLIGATTENPGFEINQALLSRCSLLRLEPLSEEALHKIIDKAIDDLSNNLTLEEEALHLLLLHSDGDARIVLNGLDALNNLQPEGGTISVDTMEKALGRRQLAYDKNGDQHYDIVSAFIKSIRGGDTDAALYYLARMEAAGEDPKFVARRLLISASEDIGLANENALTVANSVFDAVTKIGPPECWIHLAQATSYLATSEKSWASYQGLRRAQAIVAEEPAYSIPLSLRNPRNKVNKAQGYGQGYHHASQGKEADIMHFLPDELIGREIFKPE